MTFGDRVNNDYFEWLCELIDIRRFSKQVSYRKLLMRLHDIEFTWFVPHDDNRADDGVQLRRRFAMHHDDMSLSNYILGPCSVLEMMVALAIRCEETIMDDTAMGDRTGQWFWGMVHNLGLSPMIDSEFDRRFVDDTIARFLNREYEPDGRGGLFTVRHCTHDMRTVEIWCQLSWYLGSIT
jgi:hypothetical protein